MAIGADGTDVIEEVPARILDRRRVLAVWLACRYAAQTPRLLDFAPVRLQDTREDRESNAKSVLRFMTSFFFCMTASNANHSRAVSVYDSHVFNTQHNAAYANISIPRFYPILHHSMI